MCGEGVATATAAATVQVVEAWDDEVQDERGLKGFYFIYYRYVFFFLTSCPVRHIINLGDLRARTIKHPGKVPFYKCPRTNLI